VVVYAIWRLGHKGIVGLAWLSESLELQSLRRCCQNGTFVSDFITKVP
jgi:hypothetical protein